MANKKNKCFRIFVWDAGGFGSSVWAKSDDVLADMWYLFIVLMLSKQQIALLMDSSKYLKDLLCSWSLRETVQLLALPVES